MKSVAALAASCLLLSALASGPAVPLKASLPGDGISGVVIDQLGRPLAGAVVRVKATERSVLTDPDGTFTLDGLTSGRPVKLTAWMPGYYIGGGEEVRPGSLDVRIVLEAVAVVDDPGYRWLSAYASAGEPASCENCHSSVKVGEQAAGSGMPFDQWTQDAHARSTRNPRFLDMYLGRDAAGNQSPLTRHGSNRDYGSFPLLPDPGQPYYGPGYRLDFPGSAGNCAACHAPAASVDAPYATDPSRLSGVGAEGVTCDFCHKVWDVLLDPATGRPLPNTPGVLSYELRRPPDGHQLFAGPFDDVAPGEDTFTPVQRTSQYCAPCHFGAFWGTPVYDSYGEWLRSPYSEPGTGRTCQDCHMPAGLNDHFARLDKGGEVRDPRTIRSHRMLGASDPEFLQGAVTMTADASLTGDLVTVEVRIVNDGTGHHVPTDSPLRQMLLLVDARSADGAPLTQLDGPTVPDWGGVGDPGEGWYAGLPGRGYAKILMEAWTEVVPSGAYWNQTRIVSDDRIPAMGSDTAVFTFALPRDGRAVVRATLLFRRAFRSLMAQKRWDVPDIVMAQETVSLP